ncbi:cohesin domain-containing protein [Massilia sp. CCM 9210]|uniref:cohesin domain-containing protein n=1 Tax=Massilia scottii TaxID=3057166 RepID=UPI002796C42B|nr:cohesin domain-containing protein [Massilia sp. CCM 9210]MDQ1813304.1 cohesin domain-containing protein [Massilia sp. CCM 9210]
MLHPYLRSRTLLAFTASLVVLLFSGCTAQISHREGMQAMERQEYVEAVGKLAKATELKPDDLAYRKDWLRVRELATAKLLASAANDATQGKAADAERAYRTILQFDRDNDRARAGLDGMLRMAEANADIAKARDAIKRGETAEAVDFATRALKNAPNSGDARALKRELDAAEAQNMLIAPSLGAIYKKPINLEFRDASIKIVFDALSRTTGINFIFDRDVKIDQRTTVFLKQTTLDDAIDVILATGQLDKKVLNASSVLIYPSTPAKVREYQDLIVRVFYLANVEAKNAANMLKTVLKLKDVFVDDKYNMLILRENPETIALAERLISLHDMEEGEVMLEVEVLEINRSRLLNLGIQISDQLTIAPLSSGSGSSNTNGSANSPNFKLSDIQSLNSTRLGISLPSATINLQKIDGDANLLANPRIRVRDREKAKIMIGDKVPVVTTTSSGTFVTENIQYLDVGLKLEVEPMIYLRDEIGLKLSLEVSSLVSSIKTNNGSQAYQIGTRNFSSALRLKDGETQILAGLISDEDRSAANRIPLLGDLPVLGRLFSSQSDNRKKTEIVLSITPRLVRNLQRKSPSAETFWAGTEAVLRNKPLQLRQFESAGPTGAPLMAPAAAAAPAAVVPDGAPDAPKLAWEGANAARAGELVTLVLNIDSPELLRAASLQLGFNPAELQIVSVKEGDYFTKLSQGAFSQSVDNQGGRVSVGASSVDGSGAKGPGRILTVVVKPLIPAPGGADLSVIALTPVGAQRAIGRPGLPVVHKLTVTP